MFTHDWAPSVGGIQTVYTRLASQLSDWPNTHPGSGLNVTLVTDTPAGGMDDSRYSFEVVRQPSLTQLVREIRSADVVHVGGPALLPLAVATLLRKPLVVEHHGYQSICPNGLLLHEPEGSVCPGHFMKGNYRKCIGCNSGSLRVGQKYLEPRADISAPLACSQGHRQCRAEPSHRAAVAIAAD